MRENERDFFRPLWRRVAVTGFCAAWAIWEFSSNETTWAMIMGAVTAYCIWNFFINFDDDEKPK